MPKAISIFLVPPFPHLEGNDPLLTISEVASWLRVDDTTIRRWIKQGALEAVELPHENERKAYRVKVSQVLAAITHLPENLKQ